MRLGGLASRALSDLACVPHPECASDQNHSRRLRGPVPEDAPARAPGGDRRENLGLERRRLFLASERVS